MASQFIYVVSGQSEQHIETISCINSNMSNYPLSTKSSKKTKPPKPPTTIHSPLTERSLCQASLPQPLKKQDYGHILKGERVFVEMYYQGRVVQTGYTEYISFLGGQLCKRLNPRVSIFITNLQPREMAPIKERVDKVCPNCRIVSILWFQHCYQSKQKLPFDGYELDGEVEPSEQRSKEAEVDLGDFLADIGEDMENQFKDFLKTDKNKYVQNLHKNHIKPLDEIFPIRDYDLGQNPQKKKRPKNDNAKRRRKSVKPLSQRKTADGRQYKSMGPDPEGLRQGPEVEQGEGEAEEEGKQQDPATQKEPPYVSIVNAQISTVQNVITKYLGMENYITEEKSLSIKSKRIPIASDKNTDSKPPPSENLPLRPPISTIISKKSIQSSALEYKKNRESHRYAFSKVGSRYKDLHSKQEQPDTIDVFELQASLLAISKGNENVLLVMTASSMVEKSLREINRQATHHSAITFHIIKHNHFAAISQRASKPADVFFLHNPKRTSERGLFFSLTLQKSPLKVRMVNYRLIDEVTAYNTQIRNTHLRAPLPLQRSRLKYIKEMGYQVRGGLVKGKRVTFLNSELSCRVQQKAVEALGGEYVLKEDYLLDANVGLIVTERSGWVQDMGASTVSEQAFWRQVIRLEGEQQ